MRFLAEHLKDLYARVPDEPRHVHQQLDEFAETLDPTAEWFVGKTFTMIDLAVAPLLVNHVALGYCIRPGSTLARYHARLLARPSIAGATFTALVPPLSAITLRIGALH